MRRPTPPIVVIDTNVLVSGLLTGDPQAVTARVLDAMLSGEIRFVLSPALLQEYRDVLLRPRISARHGLTEGEVDTLLTRLCENTTWREPQPNGSAPDPGDDHLWALLAAVAGATLVTGDELLLEQPPEHSSVLSPRSFLELLGVDAPAPKR